MKTLIIGVGEVGTALFEILSPHYEVWTLDKEGSLGGGSGYDAGGIEIIHIAFPYSENFVEHVKKYQEEFEPKYTVIHSTVPVGISRLAGAVHSPIRGIHPNLVKGIMTFEKFLGGEKSSHVADYFRRAGMKVILCDTQEETELGKLLDTEYYRECIEFTHRAKRLCDQYNLPFHVVYTLFNQTYNEGYTKLGMPEVRRPVLQAIMKEVGGHCLLPNKKILEDMEK